jgi:hypothetical protein
MEFTGNKMSSKQRRKKKLEVMSKKEYPSNGLSYQPYYCELAIINNWPPGWEPDERPWAIKSTYDKNLIGKDMEK